MFLLTVVAMAFREVLGVKLGFIALTGAVILVLIVELLGERLKDAPSFEHIVQELDWRAVFFYIALFALVGGLEKTHILEMMADAMKPLFAENFALGATLLYWVTIPIVGLVEHDAYILTFLYMIRDLGKSGVADLAAVVDGAVVRHARQQPHGRGRAGALCGAAHRREGGGPQGLAAGVPVLERGVHPGQLVRLLRVRHADLGAAVREVRTETESCSRTSSSRPTAHRARRRPWRAGVALAKSLGAKVTGFFAAPPATPIIYRDSAAGRLHDAGGARSS